MMGALHGAGNKTLDERPGGDFLTSGGAIKRDRSLVAIEAGGRARAAKR